MMMVHRVLETSKIVFRRSYFYASSASFLLRSLHLEKMIEHRLIVERLHSPPEPQNVEHVCHCISLKVSVRRGHTTWT